MSAIVSPCNTSVFLSLKNVFTNAGLFITKIKKEEDCYATTRFVGCFRTCSLLLKRIIRAIF